jgi:putative ABC transport system permease protein
MAASLTYLLQDLWRYRLRTLLVVAGLAVTVFSYLVLSALAAAMASFGVWTEAGQSLVIVEARLADPREGIIPGPVVAAARELPAGQVARVSPLQMRDTRVGDYVLQLLAADPADWAPVFELELVAGRWPQGPAEVVVGQGVPAITGWQPGTTIRLFGSDFQVAGVVRAPATSYGSIWMTPAASETLFGPGRGYQLVVVILQPGVDAEGVRAGLEADPRVGPSFAVYHQEALTRRFAEGIRDVRAMTAVVGAIALFSIALGSYSAAALTLGERRREVTILRAVGYGPAAISALVLAWSAIQAVLAYALGAIAAALFTTWQQGHSPLIILGASLPLHLAPRQLAVGLALALALALLGAAVSALAAGRRPVAEALRL